MRKITRNIADHSKKYETIVETMAGNAAEITGALDMVRTFLLESEGIVYGGMALDLNLKMIKHPGIYSETVLPDYDILIPDHYENANRLGKILHEAGYGNISVIEALSIRTRRVRVNFIPVADFTFVSRTKYYKLPQSRVNLPGSPYHGLRIINPDYLKINAHLMMHNIYSTPPMEAYTQRFEKDMKRLCLMLEFFPDSGQAAIYEKGGDESGEGGTVVKAVPAKVLDLKNEILSGIPALAFIRTSIRTWLDQNPEFAGKEDVIRILGAGPEVKAANGGGVEVEIPSWMANLWNIRIITGDSIRTLSKFGIDYEKAGSQVSLRYEISSLGDLPVAEFNDIVLVNAMGIEVNAYSGQLVSSFLKDGVKLPVWLSGSSTLLFEFKMKKYDAADESGHSEKYDRLYNIVLRTISAAEMICASLMKSGESPAKAFYFGMPCFIPATVCDFYPHSSNEGLCSAQRGRLRISELIRRETDISLSYFVKPEIVRPPNGFFPNRSLEWPEFKYETSVLYNSGPENRSKFRDETGFDPLSWPDYVWEKILKCASGPMRVPEGIRKS